MRDVVVIGAGLSGLTAAYELERQGVDYTLIEVKRHLGGSIRTVQRAGFAMDAGAFALADTFDRAWLGQLGLADALVALDDDSVGFVDGTQMLIDALSQTLTAPRLMRMAVSSIGELENGRYSICLENGILLDARAVIVAVPARYAQRLFYGYITELTEHLLDYHYDTVHRISLGFVASAVPDALRNPPDMGYVFNRRTTHPARVPDGHVLWQFGLRLAPERVAEAQTLIDLVCQRYGLPAPVSQLVSYWGTADAISCYDDAHSRWVADLRAQLPAGIALIGSDYSHHAPIRRGRTRLDERITQGQTAAQAMIDYLEDIS
jgi:protoporphyrinogen oxidase